MKRHWRILSVFGAIGGLVFGVGTAQKVDAAPLSPRLYGQTTDMVARWGSVRDDMQKAAPRAQIRKDIADVLDLVDLRTDLEQAIRLSYAMASRAEIELLDDLWLETLIARGDSLLISNYLSIRATLDVLPPNTGQYYMERWLWEAKGTGNGSGGNPGNDKDVGGAGENPNGGDDSDFDPDPGTKGRSN